MSSCSRLVEGAGGNREVPSLQILDECGDLRAARVEANFQKEGRSWGKHCFPHATKPKAEEETTE